MNGTELLNAIGKKESDPERITDRLIRHAQPDPPSVSKA